MPRIIKVVRQVELFDWSGELLNKKILKLLRPGCIVRVIEEYDENLGDREPCRLYDDKIIRTYNYYKILKIKDGTLWGKVQDYYKVCRCKCREKNPGDIMTFRFENITEVPILFQPKSIRKKMKKFRME